MNSQEITAEQSPNKPHRLPQHGAPPEVNSQAITAKRPVVTRPDNNKPRPTLPRPTVATAGRKSVAESVKLSNTLSEDTKRILAEQGLHPTDPRALSVAVLAWIASSSGRPNIAQRGAIIEFTDVLRLTPQSRARCMQWVANPPDRTTALLCAETLRHAIAESGALINPSHAARVATAAERIAQTTPKGRRAPMDKTESACVDAIVAALGTDVGLSWFELSQELAADVI